MAWLGRKKLAFIPLSRTNSQPPDIIPTDWAEQITQRVFFDKDRWTGADRSLRAYIHTVSSGWQTSMSAYNRPKPSPGRTLRPTLSRQRWATSCGLMASMVRPL